MNAAPLQADQFTNSRPGPHAHREHRGVWFGNEFDQFMELLGCETYGRSVVDVVGASALRILLNRDRLN